MLFPCLAFSTLENRVGLKHTMLPDGQPPPAAFTVLAQLCGPKANEAQMGSALFTKNGEGKTLPFLDLPIIL